jgi:Spx/MgsR family transcriptional regulator
MTKKLAVYGIKNCDTMKKAFAWLDKNKLAYDFHDYKKGGADESVLARALKAHGWKDVLNTRGMTWRNLPDSVKTGMTDARALKTALENPSVIRRPLIVDGNNISLGFDEQEFAKRFGS